MSINIGPPIVDELKPKIAVIGVGGAGGNAIANMIGALRGIPVDQLLDLAIARMRAALPKGVEAPRVEPLKFHIIQIPRSTGGSK